MDHLRSLIWSFWVFLVIFVPNASNIYARRTILNYRWYTILRIIDFDRFRDGTKYRYGPDGEAGAIFLFRIEFPWNVGLNKHAIVRKCPLDTISVIAPINGHMNSFICMKVRRATRLLNKSQCFRTVKLFSAQNAFFWAYTLILFH